MESKTANFQAALYTILNDDTTLSGLVKNVGDWPNANTIYPHVTIGEDRVRQDRDKSKGGISIHADVHIWYTMAEYRGWLLGKQIADRIIEILTGTELTLVNADNHYMIGTAIMPDQWKQLTEEDGKMKHLILTFQFKIREV